MGVKGLKTILLLTLINSFILFKDDMKIRINHGEYAL